MNTEGKRTYVSIYFADARQHGRRRSDVTVAFAQGDELGKVCVKLGASRIRHLIGIDSYGELKRAAENEGRSLGNYIRHRLRERLADGV
jgi:hypothetical protein